MNSPRRPVIGITMDTRDGEGGYYQLGFDYAKSVEKAGGLPLANPSLYGETWHPKAARIDPDRQSFELALLAEVERRRMPTLAICLGCQLLNVYRGGSLHQFLPDIEGKEEHRRAGEGQPVRRHAVKIEPDSAIGRAIGKGEVSTNTYHKQAVKGVGRGLRVTAVSDDGTVEALEDPSFPLLAAVQWHPERLNSEAEHLAPFRLLVEKAAQNRR